jgi:hypothetical protein
LTAPVAEIDAVQEQPLGERVVGRVRQMFCALHGHDSLLQFEQDRMFLRCASCGHRSPGWELNEPPPTVTASEDACRPALVKPQLISARRIA